MNAHTSLPMKAKLAGLILGFSALVLFLTAQLFSIWYKAVLFSSFINCFREQKQGQSEYMSWMKANQRSLSKVEINNDCMSFLYSEDNSLRKSRI